LKSKASFEIQNFQNSGITKSISKHPQQQTKISSKQQTANNMSLHQWNSVAECAQLQRYVLLAEMMLL
jgi:hypothetical protein